MKTSRSVLRARMRLLATRPHALPLSQSAMLGAKRAHEYHCDRARRGVLDCLADLRCDAVRIRPHYPQIEWPPSKPIRILGITCQIR
jgi:hypothetical protein